MTLSWIQKTTGYHMSMDTYSNTPIQTDLVHIWYDFLNIHTLSWNAPNLTKTPPPSPVSKNGKATGKSVWSLHSRTNKKKLLSTNQFQPQSDPHNFLLYLCKKNGKEKSTLIAQINRKKSWKYSRLLNPWIRTVKPFHNPISAVSIDELIWTPANRTPTTETGSRQCRPPSTEKSEYSLNPCP